MGMICTVVPEVKPVIHVARETVSDQEILDASRIRILDFKPIKDPTILKYQITKPDPYSDKSRVGSDLWNRAWMLKPGLPLWQGSMHLLHKQVSTVTTFNTS